jgi:hypothetical protein
MVADNRQVNMHLSPAQRNQRASVRNFLRCDSPAEIRKEIVISLDRGDLFRADCCLEVLLEELPDRDGMTLHEFVKKHDVSVVGGEYFVTVCCQHPDLEHLTDFVVILANSQGTKLMPDPGTEVTCCPECGRLGCCSECSAYGKAGI